MSKILYVDTETTGTDPVKQDIVQLAAIAEIDGKVVEEFNMFCQPYCYYNIDAKALEVNRFTVEELREWIEPQETHKQFISFLNKYVDKYDKTDKFIVAGQKVSFDIGFVREWARKAGDKYISSYMWRNEIDLKTFTAAARAWGLLDVSDLKLETICAALGIAIKKAHDALSDARAARECLLKFKEMFINFKGIKSL